MLELVKALQSIKHVPTTPAAVSGVTQEWTLQIAVRLLQLAMSNT